MAVENGSDATGDPNSVNVDGGYSGFLYSPRIVLTVAHTLEVGQTKEAMRTVGYPGQLGQLGSQPEYNFIKSSAMFFADGYKSRTDQNWARIDDFAVIVLEKPMIMKNKVRIATPEDVKRFMDNRVPVELVGYGRQIDRNLPGQSGIVKIYPSKMVSRVLTDDESNRIKLGLPPGVIFTSDINFEQKPGQASGCDGDSGAGWFVEENGFRVYIGANSSGWGGPNCGKNGTWDRNGVMAGVSAAYRFLDLINEAELYVKEHPYIEPNDKKVKIKTTNILCRKGKTEKIFKLKKCPMGWKKNSSK